jgi:hypothetical protein
MILSCVLAFAWILFIFYAERVCGAVASVSPGAGARLLLCVYAARRAQSRHPVLFVAACAATGFLCGVLFPYPLNHLPYPAPR